MLVVAIIPTAQTFMHINQGSTSPPSLNRLHQLCISAKIIGQITLLLNPDIILIFFIKIPSSHASDVIYNASLLENAVHALSIMKLSIFLFSIVLHELNTEMYKGWIKWVALSGINTNIIEISIEFSTIVSMYCNYQPS